MSEYKDISNTDLNVINFSDRLNEALYGGDLSRRKRNRKRAIDENKMRRSLGDITKKDYNDARRKLTFEDIPDRFVGKLRAAARLRSPSYWEKRSESSLGIDDLVKYASGQDMKKPSRILHPLEERRMFGKDYAGIRDQRNSVLALRKELKQKAHDGAPEDVESIAKLQDLENMYKTNYMAGKRRGRASRDIDGLFTRGGGNMIRTGLR